MLSNAYSQLALALSFLSRLPMLPGSQYSSENFAASNRWYPLAGAFLGLLQVGVLFITLSFFPAAIATLLTLGFALWLTGCFHEDGLADSADGLFGYVDKAKALSIMKDSRLGTYGASALFITLLLKWHLWQETVIEALVILIAVQAVSRWVPVLVMNFLPYAEANEANRKPSASQQSWSGLVIATLCTLPWLVVLPNALLGVASVVAIAAYWRFYLNRRLGGWTGDTLGALQVVAEIALLLCILV